MPISDQLQKVNNFAFDRINKNYDYMLLITGNEGTGKSRGLMLNIIDDWYNRVLKHKAKYKPFVTDFLLYPKLLQDSNRFDICALDEAGDSLDNTQTGLKAKTLIYQSYTIIREKGIYSIIVLPSIFDFNSKFVRRRVNMLLHADYRIDNYCHKDKVFFTGNSCPKCNNPPDKKGFVSFVGYRRKGLQALVDANQDQRIKKMSLVSPTFKGRVGEYDGEYSEEYAQDKRTKTEQTLQKLNDEINKMAGKTKDSKTRCPNCNGADVRYSKRNSVTSCRKCGHEWAIKGGGA